MSKKRDEDFEDNIGDTMIGKHGIKTGNEIYEKEKDTIKVYELNEFTKDSDFPFFIQYGRHEESLFIHSHKDFSELTIVLSGEACHIVENEKMPVKKGEVFIVHGDTKHGYTDTHNFRICNIMFREDYFNFRKYDISRMSGFQALFYIEPGLVKNHHFIGRMSLCKEDFEKIRSEIDVMNNEYQSKKEGYKTFLTSKFMELLVTFSRIYEVNHDDSANKLSPLKLGEVITWIEKNFRQEISVGELSKKAGYSQRHFLRIFKETYHMTPTEYINAIRIEYACSKLRETKESVTDIAYDCGFRNMSYFYRVFNEKMNITPKKYRNCL